MLTEVPWSENPDSHSNAGPKQPPSTPALSRRGLLAATGAGVGLVAATTIGQTVTPLERIGLLAIRQPSRGPQGVPVNRTAAEAKVTTTAMAATWTLRVLGPRPYEVTLEEVVALAETRPTFPSPASKAGASARSGGASDCSTSSPARAATPTPG